MKALVIDDSALMRKHLRGILEGAGYEVDTARNGAEGLVKIESFDPTVITLDINMPVMDGITCLSLIMQQFPRPVVMVSSLTEKGALATFEALELGAVDYISKPGGTVSLNIRDIEEELVEKVNAAAASKVSKSRGLRQRLQDQREQLARPKETVKKTRLKNAKQSIKLIIIGVSTGGPGTVEEIVCALPSDFPLPILIAQHMPGRFTRVFAERLDKCAALKVTELNEPTVLEGGQIIIAHGDADVKVVKRGTKLMARRIPIKKEFLWHPSVERMAQSVLENCDPKSVICVQLTGMGNDGAKTMAKLHKLGASNIAESEETAVVYGMPRELVELGGAQHVLPSYDIAEQLIQWCK